MTGRWKGARETYFPRFIVGLLPSGKIWWWQADALVDPSLISSRKRLVDLSFIFYLYKYTRWDNKTTTLMSWKLRSVWIKDYARCAFAFKCWNANLPQFRNHWFCLVRLVEQTGWKRPQMVKPIFGEASLHENYTHFYCNCMVEMVTLSFNVTCDWFKVDVLQNWCFSQFFFRVMHCNFLL